MIKKLNTYKGRIITGLSYSYVREGPCSVTIDTIDKYGETYEESIDLGNMKEIEDFIKPYYDIYDMSRTNKIVNWREEIEK